jgi:mevalonate kinase
MTNPTLKIQLPGKWILAGEHSILRGGRAVALPRLDLMFQLEFEKTQSGGLKILPESSSEIVRKIVEIAEKNPIWLVPTHTIHGKLSIQGNIPFGAGLGSSAAFCLAMVRWLSTFAPLDESEICKAATLFENQFHGKSSGIDVAAIYAAEPIRVKLVKTTDRSPSVLEVQRLAVKKVPRFTFHDTQLRASTQECVMKVEGLFRRNPSLGRQVDQNMDQAAEIAEKGLIEYSLGKVELGKKSIAISMRQAQQCFHAWGLVPQQAQDLENRLLSEGALAVKLTGSGDGGIMVALWN